MSKDWPDPIDRFKTLFEQAKQTDLREPTAVTLATADEFGQPSIRTVLLKTVDQRGFVIFTNFNSRKGRQLIANPHAALCFFWQPFFEQVVVEGLVEVVSDAEADDYWATRSRQSQVGAWASDQSQPLDNRETLEHRVRMFEEQFGDGETPRPPHWSGFRVRPQRIEFWQSGAGRLHDRFCYSRDGDGWSVTQLNP